MNDRLALSLAGACGVLASLAVMLSAESVIRTVVERSSAVADSVFTAVYGVLAPLRRAERAGARASSRERARLRVVAATAGAMVGWLVAGMFGSLLCAAGAATLVPRVLDWRVERYRRRVDDGAAAAARALAGALSAGRSVRASFGVATDELAGPIAVELSRVASELALGERTQDSLEGLRLRVGSARLDMIVAAILVQRRSGGDLATLLRRIADTIAEQDRLRDEARAASAQARFTSTVVLVMPVAGVALGELASPGLVTRLAASTVGVWLLGVALVLQIVGALAVRRFARVPS